MQHISWLKIYIYYDNNINKVWIWIWLLWLLKPKHILDCKNDICFLIFFCKSILHRLLFGENDFSKCKSYYLSHSLGGEKMYSYISQRYMHVSECKKPGWNLNSTLQFLIPWCYPLHHPHTQTKCGITQRVHVRILEKILFQIRKIKNIYYFLQ